MTLASNELCESCLSVGVVSVALFVCQYFVPEKKESAILDEEDGGRDRGSGGSGGRREGRER